MKKVILILVGFALAMSASIFAGKYSEANYRKGRGDCGTCTDVVHPSPNR